MRYTLLSLVLVICPLTHADVLKCVDAQGKITFTDGKCKPAQKSTAVVIKPTNIVDGSADRRAIYQVKQNEYKQARANYYQSLKHAADRQRAYAYDNQVKSNNARRMQHMNTYYPNSNTAALTSRRNCHVIAHRVHCS